MSIPWLQELEERVQQTSERLRELRAENEELKGRIVDLEAELEAARAGESDGGAWAEERDEIRRRVEKLAGHLEALLEDD